LHRAFSTRIGAAWLGTWQPANARAKREPVACVGAASILSVRKFGVLLEDVANQ